jgi:hypothetical protein
MPYRLLADAIVVVHVAYVAFVVLGMVAILVGLAMRREWARNVWFRGAHLVAIGVVVAETLCGVACPLTVWEQRLRNTAGDGAHPGDFLGDWAHRLIFVDAPPWAFTAAYLLFGAAVLLTFILAPPRWPTSD